MTAFTVIRIRPIEPRDAARWGEMRCTLWPELDPGELPADTATYLAGTDTLLEAVLVAEDQAAPERSIVGFVELSRRAYAEGCSTSPVGYVEGWFIEPGYRRTGVGRALMSEAEAWARSRGCGELASDALVDNTVSAATHRSLGFEEVVVIRCFRKAL